MDDGEVVAARVDLVDDSGVVVAPVGGRAEQEAAAAENDAAVRIRAVGVVGVVNVDEVVAVRVQLEDGAAAVRAAQGRGPVELPARVLHERRLRAVA